jgi:purine-binding chemotaxis protein CheW
MVRKKKEKVELTGDEEQIVSFKLGKETFGIKVSQVREIGKVQDITKIPKMPSFIEGVLNLRGQITTVIDLKKRLNIVIEGDKGITSASRIIIAEIDDAQIGIIVDAVEDVMRVPRSSISLPPTTLTGGTDTNFLTGLCKLQDRLVMLLDLNTVMSISELEHIEGRGTASVAPAIA